MVGLVLELILVATLVAVIAFLSASEIALVSASKPHLRALAADGDRAAKRVLDLTETPARFLATVQIGITVASFFAAAVGAVTLNEYVEDLLDNVPISFIAEHNKPIALILITAVLAFLSIVLGELAPKTMAVNHAERIALAISGPVSFLSQVMQPVVRLLTGVTNLILRFSGSHQRANMPSVSEAEILALLETAEDEGVVDPEDADLVEEALGFGEIQVRSVMVHRVDVEAVDAGTTLADTVEIFFRTGYSRLPVYRETPDEILGVLHIKDVFRLVWDNPNAATLRAAELVRPAYIVPETRPIDDTLQDLRHQRTHMAIVVDEYGGLAGVVTLEDLIEELVGEIADEFDPGYEPLREVEPDVFDIDGRLSLHDLLDRLDLDKDVLTDVQAESVGGLITDRLERIPEVGDCVEVGPLCFEVKSMDGFRVATVRVRRLSDEGIDQDDQPTGET